MFVTDRKMISANARAPRRSNAGWLCLIAALSVVAAGCAVAESALPLLPPAPVFSSGTFAVANNFAPCPAGSTPANPGGQQCAIAGATGTVDVLTDAFLGSSYTSTVTTRGGTIPVTSCQIQGTVPAGVVLSASPAGATCVITGTFPSPLPSVTIPPGGFAAISLTVRATDSGNPASADTQDVVIRIFAGFTFITTVLENGTQGRAYTKIVVSNLSATIGSQPMTVCTTTPALPAGLSIAPVGNNCRITGIPTVSGAFSVTVNGTDSAANTRSSIAFPLVINAPLVVTPPVFTRGTVGRPYTITVASTAATTGGQRPLTVCSAAGLPPGLTVARNAANTACEITGTPTTAGAFNAVVVSATDSATTDPAQGGATVTAAGTSAAAAASITINPVLAVPAFVIGNGTQGRAFTLSVPSTGGNQPLTLCSATGLAAGMTIGVDPGNTSNCLINGTPTANGAFTVVVTATDTATANTVVGSASSLNSPLQVNPPLAIPVFTFQAGAETVAYTRTIPTSGGNRPLAVCNAVGLATGLTIALDPANTAVNVNNCIVSGTPAVGSAGPYTVVVTVTDTASTTTVAGNAASANTALTINGPLVIPPFVLGNGTEGRAFTQDVPVTGGIQPLTNCTISAGALPGGLTIAVSPVAGNCRLSGTPAAATAGAFAITVQATDTGAPPGTPPATATSASTPLLINAPLLIATLNANVLDAINGRVGYTLAFANTGGQTTFSWGAVGLGAGACSGMSLSAAGVLTGTPTTPGLCNFTASVTDTATASTAAGTTPGAFTLTVRPELTFAVVVPVDGVEGRNYGLATDTCPGPAPCVQAFPTNALAVAGATDKASAENGNGPLVSCTVLAVTPGTPGPNSLGLGNFAAIPDPGNLNRCRLQSTGPFPALSADVYRITVGATDNPIAAVGVPASIPANVNTNFILTVRTVLTLTEPLGDPLPDAVTGRSYGLGATCGPAGTAFCVPVIYTAAGGIPAYTIAVTAGAFPAGFSSVAGASTLTFSAANVTAPAGGPTAVTVTVTDVGNTAVPTAPGAPVAVTRNITVQAALALASNPAVDPPPPAVQGRSYGGPGFTPLTYTASGGLGSYNFPAIASIPAAGTGVPASMTCTQLVAVVTCTTGAGVITTGPGAFTFNVSVTDTANQSTPASAPVALATNPQNITVNAPLNFAAVNQGDPLNIAVQNRSYGTVIGKATVFYTVAGGLGSGAGGYVFTTPAFSAVPASAFPSGFSCATLPNPNANNFFCSSPSVTGAPGLYPNIPVTIDDVANAATPSGTTSGTTATVTRSLTVNAPLTFTENVGVRVGNAITLPTAVVGRAVGPSVQDPTRVNHIFTASGGLPGYATNAVTAPPNPGIPPGFFCILAAATVTCGTSGAPIGAPVASPFTYNAIVTDNQNGSIPTDTVTLNNSMAVNAAISQTTAPTSPLPFARQNSPYGTGAGCSGGACVPVTFTADAASGLGTFTFGSAGFPAGIVCAPVGNVLTCSAASVTGAPGPFTPSVTINDVANATTTDHATDNGGVLFTVNENVTVFAPLNIPALAAGTFDGTNGRPFTQNLPFTGGVAPFLCSGTVSAPNLAISFGGVDCLLSGSPLAADVGGQTANVTVTDTNNATTPTGSASTGVMLFTVNDVLTITNTTLPGAATTIAYGVAPTSTVVITGGESPFTWNVTTAGFFGPGPIQNGVAATPCQGLTFDTTTGAFGGTPVNPGACGPFTVDVNDTATTSTGDALSTVGTASQSFTITVAAPVSIAGLAVGTEDAATQGRAVGSGTGGALDYPVTNGIGNPVGTFTCAITSYNGGAFPPAGGSGFSVAFAGSACQLSGTPTANDTANSPIVLVITVTDPATGLTDTVTTNAAGFDVFPSIAINGSAAGTGIAYPAGVENRAYNFTVPLVGGNQNGVLTLSNPGGDPVGPPITLATADSADCADLTAGAAAITGTPSATGPATCTFNLLADDAATRMSAAANLLQTGNTILVNAPMAITPAPGALVNGVAGLVYNSGTAVTFTVTGGLGGYTFVDPGDAATAVCAPLGNFPPGLTFPPTSTATTSDLGGTPTTPNTVGVPVYSFEICVQDTANPATAQGSATSAGNFDIRVMQPLAFAAGPGDNSVQVMRTAPVPATAALIGTLAPIALAGTAPHSTAVTPNGREVWVTMEGSDTIERFDTVTFAALASIDLTAGTFAGAGNQCTAPRGIVHGFAGTSNNRTYVACSADDRITVIDTAALARVAGPGTTSGAVTDLALTPDGSRVYAVLFTNNDMDFLATATNTITNVPNVVTTDTDGGLAISPDGSRLFVGDSTNQEIVMVPIPAHIPTTTFALAGGDEPRAIAFDPTGARVYITFDGPNTFDVRDGTTGARLPGAPFNVHSATITTASRTAGDIVTLTFANEHGFIVGQTLTIAGVTGGGFDGGLFTITGVTLTTVTYDQGSGGVGAGTGGTAVVSGTDPFGITIPPSDGVVRVITVLNGNAGATPESFVVHDDSATPTRTSPNQAGIIGSNPAAVAGTSLPTRISHIPRPR